MKFVTFRFSWWWFLGIFVLVVMVGFLIWWSPSVKRQGHAAAIANLDGGPLAPELSGVVRFIPADGGTQVVVEVAGLPPYQPGVNDDPPIGPHGFHIHGNGDCTAGDPSNPFQAAGGHYNPTAQPHGNHAGDLPVLFSNSGYASMAVFTGAFRPADVIGKAVVIHQYPDDYRSQPAGSAGKRLACGVIVAK